SYRRKLGNPVNGIRSWSFKDFAEKPLCSFGVMDSNNVPLPSYYSQKRTFAPFTLSCAFRYMLESLPAGTTLKVPVWLSNATDETAKGSVESSLFNLQGQQLQSDRKEVLVPSAQAQAVVELDWHLPDRPGPYLLRSRFAKGGKTLAQAEMYLKIVPRVTRKPQRVLVLGTPDWAH